MLRVEPEAPGAAHNVEALFSAGEEIAEMFRRGDVKRNRLRSPEAECVDNDVERLQIFLRKRQNVLLNDGTGTRFICVTDHRCDIVSAAQRFSDDKSAGLAVRADNCNLQHVLFPLYVVRYRTVCKINP